MPGSASAGMQATSTCRDSRVMWSSISRAAAVRVAAGEVTAAAAAGGDDEVLGGSPASAIISRRLPPIDLAISAYPDAPVASASRW